MSEKIVDKIAKLFKMAESAEKIGSVKEAAAFAEQAEKLLQKHNLSMDEVELHEAKSAPISVERVETTKPFPIWEAVLLQTLAKIHGVEQLEEIGTGHVVLVGRADDRAITINFFRFFRKTGQELARDFEESFKQTVEYFTIRAIDGDPAVAEKTEAFMYGYSMAISLKLEKVYRSMKMDSSLSNEALIYLGNRQKEARTWLEQRANVSNTPDDDRWHGKRVNSMDDDYIRLGFAEGDKAALTDKILG